jgi:hypothetical protein
VAPSLERARALCATKRRATMSGAGAGSGRGQAFRIEPFKHRVELDPQARRRALRARERTRKTLTRPSAPAVC